MAIDVLQPKTVKLRLVRKEPEVVRPAQPTPRETKEVSDIDDQKGLWCHMPAILFYQADPSMHGKDQAAVVKEGLAKALVFYYPLAGRLRPGPDGKLVVDCTGEGVLFTEAKAEAKLEDFGDEINLPFPLEELLYDVPGTKGIVDTPLLIVQVTSLKCGGFIVAVRSNHVVMDGGGRRQFLVAVAEMARGLPAPVIPPMWQRERLNARPQPCVSYTHHEYEEMINNPTPQTHQEDVLVQRCLLFRSTELTALKNHYVSPINFERYTTFEILTALLWRSRIIALGLDPSEEVRLLLTVNARSKFNPPLPKGYYGNTCAFPIVRATSGEICEKNPISYISELIKQRKREVTEDYMKSVADLMVIQGRPPLTEDHRIYEVSDLRQIRLMDVDFGWGKPVFGGPGRNWGVPESGSFFIPYKNNKGESMTMVPVALPSNAMGTFVKELRGTFKLLKTRL